MVGIINLNNILLLSLSVAEYTQIVSVTIAFVVCIFTCVQIWKKIEMSHAEQVAKMLDKVWSNPEMVKLYYQIEYGGPSTWYDGSFHNSDMEKTVDGFLRQYEYIMLLRKRGLLRKGEFHFFEYYIKRIVGDKNMQDYFYNLYRFCKKNTFPYPKLLKYMINNGFLNADEFEKRDSMVYKKVLNF